MGRPREGKMAHRPSNPPKLADAAAPSRHDRRRSMVAKEKPKPNMGARLAEAAWEKAAEQRPSKSNPPKLGAAAAAFPSQHGGRRSMVAKEKPKPNMGARLAEVAGEKAAECAAIVCCLPCGLANLLFIATVKLPAGLVKRALRQKRKLAVGYGKNKGGLLQNRVGCLDEDELSIYRGALLVAASPELVELEKEMSARFYGAGFWRSPSQKEGGVSALEEGKWLKGGNFAFSHVKKSEGVKV